jgi:hypothetical protein
MLIDGGGTRELHTEFWWRMYWKLLICKTSERNDRTVDGFYID